MAIIDTCSNIISLSDDGDRLSPRDLKFIENCVNYGPTEAGEVYLYELESKLEKGIYQKSWMYDVEDLTQDHEGFVYYKDSHVEHYSFRDHCEGKKAAIKLRDGCRELEKRGVVVSFSNYMKYCK